ncbi:MAG: phosphodiester glycosidase family protein [Muribaculaceae bacterium]|nr:phosphodiester glycosidase family protein [Muribaculaceae bacterium]
MKKIILSLLLASTAMTGIFAEDQSTINLNGKDYTIDELIVRQEGPGITYRRIRIPDYPLNVNMLEVDLTNPYNRVETMQASETLYKTEKLVTAATRYTTDDKRVIGGANANFWCVSSQQPHSDLLIGATYNGNLRNGKIITETNAYSDQWDGGPSRTGVIAIDTNKRLYVESMNYKGYAKNDKIGSPEIIQVNKIVRDNEIALYNSFYGTSKSFMPVDQYKGDDSKQHFKIVTGVATEVYLSVNSGQSWLAGQDMVCTVQEVKTDAGTGTLGSYDLCLVGRGVQKDLLAQLSAGDQVTINYGWTTADGTSTPVIEQLVGGNAIVMQDGVLTGRNTDETYNSQVYSRTGYGASADGKTLYIIVIDKSTDAVYGASAGCSTTVMCEIMKYYGCDDVVTMDAGGSAQMLLNGEIVNKTTEGTPRAVANGWFVYSVAPQDEVVARIEFAEKTLVAPPYSTYSPKVLGYNQYGDLIDEDLQGFTLSCTDGLGTCNGMTFTAGGQAMAGKLTATYNGITCTASMAIEQADLTIRIKPTILIDAAREYPMEVTAAIGDNVYSYDPSSITWKVKDESVATIDANGVLHGLYEGETEVVGEIGEFSDTTTVRVEIANAPKMYPTDYTGWTLKTPSGITNGTLSSEGIYTFTYGAPRGTSIAVQMSKQVRYYSLPDRLWLSFTTSVPLTSIDVDLRSPFNTRANNVNIAPIEGETFAVNEEHRVEIPISTPEDLIMYPLTMNAISFNIKAQTSNKGDHSIKISEISAEYSSFNSGIESVSAETGGIMLYPNPVADTEITVKATQQIYNVDLYTIAGTLAISKKCCADEVKIDVSSLASGIYLVNVATGNDAKTIKLIVE